MYLGTTIRDILASVERAEQTKHPLTTTEETELSTWVLSSTENQQSSGPGKEVRSNGSHSPSQAEAARIESDHSEKKHLRSRA